MHAAGRYAQKLLYIIDEDWPGINGGNRHFTERTVGMEGGLLQRKLLEGTDLIKSIFQEKIFSGKNYKTAISLKKGATNELISIL